MRIKSKIYQLLRISNDFNALRRGKFHKRLGRRITGRMTGKAMGKMFNSKGKGGFFK